MHMWQIKDISNLEKVPRKAARFVKQYYSKYNSVTGMIPWLGLKNYKIVEKNKINDAI